VSLAQRRAEVRARPAFRMPAVVPSARAREQELVDLLRASRPATELPVRVATYTYEEPGTPRLRVVVSTEADAAEGPASQVLLGFVLIDGKGVIASSGAYRSEAARHAFSTQLAPGDYTLRVAAIDPMGRRGSLERPFTAAIPARSGVRVSDVILAPVPPSPEQPLEPVVDRVSGSEVVAYVELYADEGGQLRDVAVDVDITSSDAAPPLVTTAADVVRRDARWATARAVVPLDAVRAGRYLARLHVSADGQRVTTVVRPFLRH
jgi:hypothetical protein